MRRVSFGVAPTKGCRSVSSRYRHTPIDHMSAAFPHPSSPRERECVCVCVRACVYARARACGRLGALVRMLGCGGGATKARRHLHADNLRGAVAGGATEHALALEARLQFVFSLSRHIHSHPEVGCHARASTVSASAPHAHTRTRFFVHSLGIPSSNHRRASARRGMQAEDAWCGGGMLQMAAAAAPVTRAGLLGQQDRGASSQGRQARGPGLLRPRRRAPQLPSAFRLFPPPSPPHSCQVGDQDRATMYGAPLSCSATRRGGTERGRAGGERPIFTVMGLSTESSKFSGLRSKCAMLRECM